MNFFSLKGIFYYDMSKSNPQNIKENISWLPNAEFLTKGFQNQMAHQYQIF